MVSNMTNSPARLIRRVIERDEEPEEVEVGRVTGHTVHGVDTPHLYLQAEIAPEYRRRFEEAISVPLRRDIIHTREDSFNVDEGSQRTNIIIPVDTETVVRLRWGNESFSVRFPVKGEGEVTHDVPVGRVEWIIETREEETLEAVHEEDLEDLDILEDEYLIEEDWDDE